MLHRLTFWLNPMYSRDIVLSLSRFLPWFFSWVFDYMTVFGTIKYVTATWHMCILWYLITYFLSFTEMSALSFLAGFPHFYVTIPPSEVGLHIPDFTTCTGMLSLWFITPCHSLLHFNGSIYKRLDSCFSCPTINSRFPSSLHRPTTVTLQRTKTVIWYMAERWVTATHADVAPLKLLQLLAPANCLRSKNNPLPHLSAIICWNFFLYTYNCSCWKQQRGQQCMAGLSQSCHGPLDNLSRRPWHVFQLALRHALGGHSGNSTYNECPACSGRRTSMLGCRKAYKCWSRHHWRHKRKPLRHLIRF